MQIPVNKNVVVNYVILRNIESVEIDEENKIVKFSRQYFNNMGEVGLTDIKTMYIDGNLVVKNGRFKIGCKNCNDCPFCSPVELKVYFSPNTFIGEQGYHCGYLGVYSDDLSKLKRSKIKHKWMIEEQKSFEQIERKFKRRRQEYITDESIKECLDDIHECMTPYNSTADLNEYGHRRIDLESIRVYKNDYGYIVSHYGRMGDDGWSSTIRIHKKCNMSKLIHELRFVALNNNCKFQNELV